MRTFAVIGGDKRNVALAELLFKQGHMVKLYGFVNYERELPMQCKKLHEAVVCADYIIGPIPCSHHGGALNAPFHNGPIYVEDVFRLLRPHQVFFAGFMKPEIFAMAQKHGIQAIDILEREELLVANAIPTALEVGTLRAIPRGHGVAHTVKPVEYAFRIISIPFQCSKGDVIG